MQERGLMMKNKMGKIIFSIVAAIAVSLSFCSGDVFAELDVGVKTSDVYEKLHRAMQVNVSGSLLKRCIQYGKLVGGQYGTDTTYISPAEALNGSIFGTSKTDMNTALWLEKAVGKGSGAKAGDGLVWCYETDGSNALNQFVNFAKTENKGSISMESLLCNGGNHGLIQRATDYMDDYGGTTYILDQDNNCNQFNDNGAMYLGAKGASDYFESVYNNWYQTAKEENPYLPSYSELGDYDNVDGYFGYIEDFNSGYCPSESVLSGDKQSGVTYSNGVATFEKQDNKLVITNRYYHVTDNHSWSSNGGLVGGGPNECYGLLTRITELQSVGNGVARGGRDGGYENILLAELDNTCKTTITENEGEIKEKLNGIINGSGSDEAKAKAQQQLDDINSGKYITSSGSRDKEGGEIYQCTVDLAMENYEEITPVAATSDESQQPEPDCYNSGAGASMGWVLCPVLDVVSGTTGFLYGFVEKALKVEPQLFSQSDSYGTRYAWGVFQGIANVLFVILFLVVIFSQVTGYGINNYGIKKILPKLIIAAILINLSYIICLICVDLSNILGNGLKAFFDGLPTGSGSPEAVSLHFEKGDLNVGELVGSVGGGILLSVGLLAGLVTAVWAVLSPAGIIGALLALLTTAISVFVGIAFIFLLLAAREAAIVVLTVLSPLAFACFILPNTKSLFDKWWKAGEALLLLYPICGLLIGGGNYVSRLLLTTGMTDGFFTALMAMIVGIVPLFFIPTLLKSSLNAFGSLGTKMSGIGKNLGSRLSGGVDKGIQGSERYKNYQADRSRRRKIAEADRTMRRYGGRADLSDRQRRLLAQAQLTRLGEESEELKRERLRTGGYEAEMAGIRSNADAEGVKNEEAIIMNNAQLRDNTGGLRAGLTDAILRNDEHQIRAYQNVLSRKGDAGREAVRQAMIDARVDAARRGVRVDHNAELAYASNLMNNWASDYKDNNRSTYDYANGVLNPRAGEPPATLLQDSSANIGSLKTSQLANMDDDEFDRLVMAYTDADGNIDPELADLCHSTLQDINATTSAKESRMQRIRSMAERSRRHQQQTSQQQASQRTQQQQEQMAQNLQNINDILSRHNNGGNNQ